MTDPLHSLKAIPTASTNTPTRNQTRPLTHSHSTPPRYPGPAPSLPRSALATALVSFKHDPLVRWALEATANNNNGDDDIDENGGDKEKFDTNDPAYVRNRIHRAAAALDKSGNDMFEQGEYDQAFERYSKALALKKKSLHDVSSSYSSSSTPAREQRQPQESKYQFQDNEQDDRPQDDHQQKSIMASLATSINNTALLKQRAGHASTEETMASYLKSLQIKRDILGPDHLSVGKTLNNIGSVFYLKREFEPAMAAYKDACRIMTAQLGSEHLDVGTVICNIGDVYCATGVTVEALEQYRRALPIRWKNLGPNNPKVVRLMEQISSLEMGILPQKEEDHLSDSEGEEFAEEDKQRHSKFKEDLRTLQRELAEDMKFFDLMEREAAIDMVKDKTRVFRELRELANPPSESKKVNLPIYAPSASVLQQPLELHHTPILDMSVEDASESAEQIESLKKASESAQQMGSVEEASESAQQMESVAVDKASESAQQMESDRVLSAGQQRSKSLLSNDQRKDALSSVRERLAKLRASRGNVGSGNELPAATTRPVERRSYMEPTASSFAKTTTPTRLFLGTPERKKVGEGINNLRNASKSSAKGRQSRPQASTTA